MKNVNILVLAAGVIDIDVRDGGYPICLTEIEGRPIIEWIVAKTSNIKNAKYTFALREEEVAQFHLDKIADLLTPGACIVKVPQNTLGSACTALLAASRFPSDEEILIISANELVDVKLNDILNEFRQRNLDGGTITFTSVHPRYSYVRLDDDELVTEATQQKPISKNATTGIFWFARSGDFVESIKNIIRKESHVNGKYYVAKTFNELILKQKQIGISKIETYQYRPLKTERQIYQVEQHGVAV